MNRFASFLLLAAGLPVSAQQPPQTPEPAFKMQCVSTLTRMLPKGNAGAGSVDFTFEADPAGQRVTVKGEKRAAKIEKSEISFRGANGPMVSINRATGKFHIVDPIRDADPSDSRQYVYYEGNCKKV